MRNEQIGGRRNGEDLQVRTKDFALRVIRLVEALPRGRAADVMGKQLLRSATSVGANYRAACRARSRAEFLAKLGIVEEEADETLYWLDLIAEAELIETHRIQDLMQEGDEILAIIVTSIKTARSNHHPQQATT